MRVVLLALSLLLAGCVTKPVPIAYKCPKIVLPADPNSPVKKLSSTSKPDDVIKAWVSTASAYKKWNQTVRRQVANSN